MPKEEKFFCSDFSKEQDVPLMASATRGDVWFLLEYPGRWGAKAFEESSLPEKVKNHFQNAAHPDVELRILLIRQEQSRQQEGTHFFVIHAHLSKPRMYEYHLDSYEDILSLDLETLAAGRNGDPVHLRAEPLYLVCTNGKRDQCCSMYGPALYQAMTESTGEAVWQSSHIGGHNLAPITLFFPHGIHYGRTTPDEIGEVIRVYQQGKVSLDHYRGRVSLEKHLQAAEHLWRVQTGRLDLLSLGFEDFKAMGENEWQIEVGEAGGVMTLIRYRRSVTDFEIPITCTQKKTAPITSFDRID